MPRHDRAVVDQPGDRPAVRVGLSGHHRRRHGARRARAARRARHHAAGRGGRRLARRHAGARVGGALPRSGRRDHSDRQHARAPAAGRRVERDRAQARSPPIPTGRAATTTAPGARRTRAWAWRAWSDTSRISRPSRSATSSAGGCSSPTTSATRSPSPSSRSRATCGIRRTTFVKRFDANTYLYTSRALSYFDLARQYGGGRLATRSATCPRGRCSSPSAPTGSIRRRDPRSWPRRCAPAGKDVELHVIEAPYGHDCFLLEEARQTPMIQEFLAQARSRSSRVASWKSRAASGSTPGRFTPGSAPIRTPARARCRSFRRPATCSRTRSRRPRTSTCRSTATPTRAS